MPVPTDVYVGFDSAWTDSPAAPGAICALFVRDRLAIGFEPPRLVSFAEALNFIRAVRSKTGCTLVALDQPTIVTNPSGMRPVERAAASLVGWLGGGVQPSNRGRTGMFCDRSPIWGFLESLKALQDPVFCRDATTGLHLIEVFPALALPSLDPSFFGRLSAPRYNPARGTTFRVEHWARVARAMEREFHRGGFREPADWCEAASQIPLPRKADQDQLDALICLSIAIRWRLGERSSSLLLGGLDTGYMVVPATQEVRERLTRSASAIGVPLVS